MMCNQAFSSQESFDKATGIQPMRSSNLCKVAELEKECGKPHPFMLLDHTDNITEKAPVILLIRKNRRKKSLLASSQCGILSKDASFKHQQGMQIHMHGIIRSLQLAEIPAPPST